MRIFVVSGYGLWGDFDPRAAYSEVGGEHTQIGGGETAMVNISHELAQLGHEVFVFYSGVSGRYDGVDYVRQMFIPAMLNELHHDVLIAWDAANVFRFYTRSAVRVCAFQLNDAKIGVLDHMIDLYPCPSKWHAERFQTLYPEMTSSKFRPTITNGISPGLYADKDVERVQYKVIYSSSPDRGLHHLLAVWPEVKASVPHAELHIYYDISKSFNAIEYCIEHGIHAITEPRYREVKRLLGELNHQGIGPVLHGGVSKAELARAQLSSHVMCYPCDPVQPTEGFSMSCLEGLMSGAYLLTTDADALGELWSEFEDTQSVLLPLASDVCHSLAHELVELLRRDPLPDGPSEDPRLEKYYWPNLARTWEKEVLKCQPTSTLSSS